MPQVLLEHQASKELQDRPEVLVLSAPLELLAVQVLLVQLVPQVSLEPAEFRAHLEVLVQLVLLEQLVSPEHLVFKVPQVQLALPDRSAQLEPREVLVPSVQPVRQVLLEPAEFREQVVRQDLPGL